jgi:hypothetical protein
VTPAEKWRRPDGQERVLLHLDGPPAPEPPETRIERLCNRLDACVPGWDDDLALLAVGLLMLLLGLLVALPFSWP